MTIAPRIEIGPRDRIQPVADVPGWSKNSVAIAWDRETDAFVWAHWGRMPAAPHVWEGALAVRLPGGRLLVSRSFAASPDADVACSGPLSLSCPAPHDHWELRFDGMARPTDEAALRSAPMPDGPHVPLSIDLRFAPVMPAWDAHAGMAEQSWARAHRQDANRVTGRVVTPDAEVMIDAAGFRDHSYGPRDYATLLGDSVCWAAFPDGRAVMALEVWQSGDRPSVSLGYVWDGETVVTAHEVSSPPLADLSGEAREATVVLRTPEDEVTLEVEAHPGTWWTLDEPAGLTAGVRLGDDDPVVLERPARVTWAGEPGDGWFEQILRPSAIGTRRTR